MNFWLNSNIFDKINENYFEKDSLFDCPITRYSDPFQEFQISWNFWAKSERIFLSWPNSSLILFKSNYLYAFFYLTWCELMIWFSASELSKIFRIQWPQFDQSGSIWWLDIETNLIVKLIAKLKSPVFWLRLFYDSTEILRAVVLISHQFFSFLTATIKLN